MRLAKIVFPHQLFEKSPLFQASGVWFLVESDLFFNQYRFHKQKIAFHRSSMKQYEAFLRAKNEEVHYVEAGNRHSEIRFLLGDLKQRGIEEVMYIDPTDDWLESGLVKAAIQHDLKWNKKESPLFLNTSDQLVHFFRKDKKKFFQTSFYKNERHRLGVLLDPQRNPAGGKWTFDAENRKKYPKNKQAPAIIRPKTTAHDREAKVYVEKNFATNWGSLDALPLYPTNFKDAKEWFNQFLQYRFAEFGPYEDALVKEESVLHHSLLSPLLNSGLLSPEFVLEQSLLFAEKHAIPLQSTEGFVRQIMGWREFIRGVYESKGRVERSTNFWGFSRKMPQSFYQGTTGILPVDNCIKKLLATGYNHHIERLMVIGNFMLLCEIDPNEVYRWFMEMYIDAYDWVMVPNVYGMSQFADGGLMSTKPYISGSNYLLKMSNYPKGDWTEIWDALFWRFLDKHRSFFVQNPRMALLLGQLDKMPIEKRQCIVAKGQEFLERLS